MSDDLINLIHREVERALAGRHSKRYGLVTSYDATRHLAKVTLQPEGQETGWLPIRTAHIGNGWGMAVGLTEGDQVEVIPQEGDLEAMQISGVVHSEQDVPPVAQSGEIVLKQKLGATLKMGQDGSVTINDKTGGATIVMDGSGGMTITTSGTLSING